MALSNPQYDAIMREYGRQQMENRRSLDERRQQVYGRLPEVSDIESKIAEYATSSARRLLEGDEAVLGQLKKQLNELRREKARLLREAGFPEDYMEMRYHCPDCQDTGYVDGRKCHCFLQAQMKLLYAQSNLDQVLERENFSNLTFEYYDDKEMIPQLGMTNAAYMRQVVDWCKQFAEHFKEKPGNILFTGGTGVGKTFLTNCIAKELMDQYCSVIYLSSPDLFEVFSRNKFSYEPEEDMKDTCQYILDCDLLIIDDLGTELNNSFTSAQLFYCINERMNRRKAVIISTNMSLSGLRDRYTDRVTSRIMSGYTLFPLYGSDIRLLQT